MRHQQLIALAVWAVASVLAPAVVWAEPYLMMRTGAKCSACHTNQTGGGKRTAFAHIHGKDILHDLDLLPVPPGLKPFNGELNSYVSIGGDLRVRNTTVFADQPNAAGRVPSNRAFRRGVSSNEIDLNEALLYLQVDLLPDLVTFYLDEDVTNGATTREAFGLVRGFLPWDTYLKAGRLFPTFGLRVQDDQAYVRTNTGFTFKNPDDGIEFGTQPGPFFLATSITNAQSGDKDVLASFNAYGVFEDIPVVRSITAGGSFARINHKRSVGALYGGSNLWQFTYLGELDFIDDRTSTDARRDQYASYAELDWLLLDWLNLRGTFEFLKVAGDRNQTRYTIGAEPFINRVIQPRIQYRINNAPGSEPDLNTTELIVELHLWF